MTEPSAKPHSPASSKPANFNVFVDLADTAWRVAVPVLVFVAPGILADRHFKTAPWLTLLALVIGLVFAGLLVKRQLQRVSGRLGQ